jgi:hypothetical protein
MHKKLVSFLLVVVMVLGVSSMVVAAPKKKNVPLTNNKETKRVVELADEENADEENDEENLDEEEELEEERPVLGRQHSFKEKFIGPPAFVQEMKQERIKVRGRPFLSDVPPVIKDGRVLIPVRAVTNGLGADVKWDPQEQKVTITRGEIKIEIFLDSWIYYVNGEEKSFDAVAQVINNRTFVPLRFIAEALGEKVNYDDTTGEVEIGDEESEEPEEPANEEETEDETEGEGEEVTGEEDGNEVAEDEDQ